MAAPMRQADADQGQTASPLHWLWPLMACIVGWWQIAQHWHDAVAYDAQNVYLPAAKAFLRRAAHTC